MVTIINKILIRIDSRDMNCRSFKFYQSLRRLFSIRSKEIFLEFVTTGLGGEKKKKMLILIFCLVNSSNEKSHHVYGHGRN